MGLDDQLIADLMHDAAAIGVIAAGAADFDFVAIGGEVAKKLLQRGLPPDAATVAAAAFAKCAAEIAAGIAAAAGANLKVTLQ